MKPKLIILILLLLSAGLCRAQMVIHDQSVIYQQERMVYQQWNQSDFTPTHGFLWLNPLYWLTWAWFPDYHKTDLRPLGPDGPQTQRLALVAAMQNTDNAYKAQSDTLSNTAISEAVNYSGLLSDADPLWPLYYSKEFKPLLNQQDAQLLRGASAKVQQYLLSSGTYSWYLDQSHSLAERLNTARTTTLDCGSRILTYYRLLAEYRRLSSIWETKKQQAATFLALMARVQAMKPTTVQPVSVPAPNISDEQIGDDILSHALIAIP